MLFYVTAAASAASFVLGTFYGPALEARAIRAYLKAKATVKAEIDAVLEDIKKAL